MNLVIKTFPIDYNKDSFEVFVPEVSTVLCVVNEETTPSLAIEIDSDADPSTSYSSRTFQVVKEDVPFTFSRGVSGVFMASFMVRTQRYFVYA